MESLLCIINLNSPYWNLVNFILAVFAVAVSIGYFLKPKLCFVGFVHNEKWKVRVVNKNLFFAVKEVQCEIAVSEHKCFRIEKTLDLKKDKTLVMRKFKNSEDDYVFRTDINFEEILKVHRVKTNANANERDYKYLRIRILALNFLGIRKYYERIYPIAQLPIIEHSAPKPNPMHWRKHKRCQNKMFKNLECYENA